jgi:O-antigen ligase
LEENNKALFMKKNIVFPVIVFTFTAVSLLIVWIMHNKFIEAPKINITFENVLLSLFILFSIVIGIFEVGFRFKQKLHFSTKGILIFFLTLMLVLSIFEKHLGIAGTGFFIISCLIYFISTRKLYSLNPIYLLFFAYPVLELIGTIGTSKGFRFPEMTYSFYLIPLAFSLFRLEKEMLLGILKCFIRIMLIFMAISIVNWFYNTIHYDVKIIDWITKKIFIVGIPAFKFISNWSQYNHPSYINLVFIPGLISIFYIFYKKNPAIWISKFELFLYITLCFVYQLISESRIGVVSVLLVLFLTGMYYLHIKTTHFKLILVAALIIGGIGIYYFHNKVSGFLSDPVRKTDTALAIDYIKNHPWWGMGYGLENEVLTYQEKNANPDLVLIHSQKTYVHNQFLGTIIQFGIPGAIVLILVVIGLFWYGFKNRSYLLTLFMSFYFLFMLIEEPFYTQEGITRFTIFLALFIHISECDKPKKEYELFKRFSKR